MKRRAKAELLKEIEHLQRRINELEAEGTKRKRYDGEIRRLATVIADSNDAVLVQDLEGNLTAWNRGAKQMYGWSEEEALDMNFQNIVPEEQREEALVSAEAILRGEMVKSFETKRVTKDGRVLDVWLVVTKLMDDAGKTVAIATTERDITERKRTEEKIRKLNADLEKRVRWRTAQLETANKELESFAYSVSHDLRAPLRGIDGFSNALLEDFSDKINTRGKDYLNRICAAAKRMSQLIDDLLSLSRVTRKEMKHDTVDMNAIARSIVAELQEDEPERLVEFHIQDRLVVSGDEQLLRILLTNLLNNAWKFTSKQPSARIEFGTAEVEGKTACFVRDNGVGFDMAYADQLFGAFQRLHGMKEYPGTGIGLATVQRIISRHGGQVWSEGEVGKGATFYFTLGV